MIKKSKAPEADPRTRHYTSDEYREGPHPAIETLSRRPHERPADSRRAAEYLRIERGQTT
ncbi:hypothetical protein [Paracoccus pacificus]|uniref:Uncharacterized protein n=1 Tax=Paracoccus pacificus TaxID=1463598 RepID=A0ABW4R6M8_9RHOB